MKKNSRKSKASMLVKIMLCTFSALGTFAVVGTMTNEKYHWLTPSNKTSDEEPLDSSIISENGIKIISMTKNAIENSDGYGTQAITFQCDEDTTDNVLTKLISNFHSLGIESPKMALNNL